jgi:hypothetical protein
MQRTQTFGHSLPNHNITKCVFPGKAKGYEEEVNNIHNNPTYNCYEHPLADNKPIDQIPSSMKGSHFKTAKRDTFEFPFILFKEVHCWKIPGNIITSVFWV